MNYTDEQSTQQQAASPPDAAPSLQRTATVITGDRLCTHCGYNLTGQMIVREEQYGLLIVRCPECSQVAAATEYPMLGRWANRWAAVLAALYLLFVLALLSATVGSTFGMLYGAGEIAGQGTAQALSDASDAWIAEQEIKDALAAQSQQDAADGAAESEEDDAAAAAVAPNTLPLPPGVTSITVGGRTFLGGQSGSSQYTFQDWWVLQSRSDLLALAGGWWNGIDKEAFFMWIPLLLAPLVAGCMWSVIALRRRLVGLLIIAAINMGLVAALCVIPMMLWLTTDPYWYWGAGAHVVGPRMLIISYAWAGLWLFVGLLIGRPLVRGLMRLFLPPRLRSSMAPLWLADGLQPPRPM